MQPASVPSAHASHGVDACLVKKLVAFWAPPVRAEEGQSAPEPQRCNKLLMLEALVEGIGRHGCKPGAGSAAPVSRRRAFDAGAADPIKASRIARLIFLDKSR